MDSDLMGCDSSGEFGWRHPQQSQLKKKKRFSLNLKLFTRGIDVWPWKTICIHCPFPDSLRFAFLI